jgi:hypothetical protein
MRVALSDYLARLRSERSRRQDEDEVSEDARRAIAELSPAGREHHADAIDLPRLCRKQGRVLRFTEVYLPLGAACTWDND